MIAGCGFGPRRIDHLPERDLCPAPRRFTPHATNPSLNSSSIPFNSVPNTLRAATTPPATYGGRFWLWSAGLRGCVLAPLSRRLSLPVCGTLAAGVHAGTGVGAVTHARRQVSPWLGLAVGPGLQLRVSPRVRLGLALELLGILARPDLRIAGRGTVCCGASLGAQLTLGVAVVLPGRRR